MPLTASHDEMIRAHMQNNVAFRHAYLREILNCLLSGDVETGKLSLRRYINGTVGFVQLGAALGHSSKTLMRMFSQTGNPQARNLFAVLAYLQKAEHLVLEVVATPTKRKSAPRSAASKAATKTPNKPPSRSTKKVA